MENKDFLNVFHFGVATGLSFGLFVFLLGLASWLLGCGLSIVDLISEIYIGFSPSLVGSILGLVWGFLCGFIFSIILSYIYNILQKNCNHH
ncbi:hypothetical protein ACFLY7_01840 [Patescibacteria group bacterium]